MKIFKNFFMIISAVAIILGISAFAINKNEKVEAIEVNAEDSSNLVNHEIVKKSNDRVRNLTINAEYTNDYSTLEQLTENADIIVEAEVISQETIIYDNLPFTISSVKILDVIEGDFEINDNIKIIETGGIYYPIDKFGNLYSKVDLQLEGGHTLNVNGNYYLFLESFIGPQVENAFVPLSIHNGKFEINKSTDLVMESNKGAIEDFEITNKSKFKNGVKKHTFNKNKNY